MERSRTASDKIRPFLDAMERSIDAVRRKRMEESGATGTNPTSAMNAGRTPERGSTNGSTYANPSSTSPHSQSHTPAHTPSPVTSPDAPVIGRPASADRPHENNDQGTRSENENGETPPQRLKARPKRPTPFTNRPYDSNNYRSQAG